MLAQKTNNSEQINRQLKRIGGVFLSNNGTLNNATNTYINSENMSGSSSNLNQQQRVPIAFVNGGGSPRQTVAACVTGGQAGGSTGLAGKHFATTDSIATSNTTQQQQQQQGRNCNSQYSVIKQQRRSDFYIADEKNAAALARKKKFSIELSKFKNASEFGKISIIIIIIIGILVSLIYRVEDSFCSFLMLIYFCNLNIKWSCDIYF